MNLQSGPSHSGDCQWTMNALRRIPGPHNFYCPSLYHPNLIALCENRNIQLHPIESAPPDATCSWIGSQRFQNKGVVWSNQPDIIGFLQQWNNCLCAEVGISSQFNTRQDLLCDAPEIARHYGPDFDVLVCNCHAASGQTPRVDYHQLNDLIEILTKKYRVVCTNQTSAQDAAMVDVTVCQIGNMALRAKFIVAVGSGCHWGIHSVWSQDVPKYILLEPQIIDFGVKMPHHGLVMEGMLPQLQKDGWL